MASSENLPLESESSTEIRAPIPQRRMTLIEEYYIPDSGYNLRPRKRPAENSNSQSKKKRNSEELDIFHKGSFESSRIFAQNAQKWLMVNIEPSVLTEWQLDRTLGESDELKTLISEHFVVWQEYQFSRQGKRCVNFYRPVNFPYLGVLDPATGEKVAECHSLGAATLFEFVSQFLSEYLRYSEESSSNRASGPPSEIAQTGYAQEPSHIEEDIRMDATENNNDTDVSLPKNNIKGVEKKTDVDAWKKYLGGESDPKLDFVIRLPNGERRELSWPGTSKLQSLYSYAEELGFDMIQYEIVAVHPRRCLTEQDLSQTLEGILFPREVLFLQPKMVLSN